MSVFTRGPYGRLAVVLNTLSSINIEEIIIIIIIIIIKQKIYMAFYMCFSALFWNDPRVPVVYMDMIKSATRQWE